MNATAKHLATKSHYERKHQPSPLVSQQGSPRSSRTRDKHQRIAGAIKVFQAGIMGPISIDADRRT